MRRQAKNEAWPRVLIVEDDMQQAQMTEWLVHTLWPKAAIETARHTEQALDMALLLKPDLVLTDVQLGAESGIDVCRLIRKNPALKNTKLVAITGFPTTRARYEAASHGASALLSKPLDPKSFRAKLASLI